MNLKDIVHYVLSKTDWMKTFVGISFVSLFVFTVVYILTQSIPDSNREIAHFIAGEVAGAALTIAAYYFGSSKGSQEKQNIIREQSDKLKTDG